MLGGTQDTGIPTSMHWSTIFSFFGQEPNVFPTVPYVYIHLLHVVNMIRCENFSYSMPLRGVTVSKYTIRLIDKIHRVLQLVLILYIPMYTTQFTGSTYQSPGLCPFTLITPVPLNLISVLSSIHFELYFTLLET